MGKSRISYTFNDLIRLEGGFLKEFWEKKEVERAVELCKLAIGSAASSGRNIENYSVIEAGFVKMDLGVPSAIMLSQLNSFMSEFFSRIDQKEVKETEHELDAITETLAKDIATQKLKTSGKNLPGQDLRRSIQENKQNYMYIMDEITKKSEELRKKEEDAEYYKEQMKNAEEALAYIMAREQGSKDSREATLSRGLLEIKERGRFRLIGAKFEQGAVVRLMFEAKSDVIMRQFNPVLEIDRVLNFGKLRLLVYGINSDKPTALVVRGKNSLAQKTNGHMYHPNIFSSGGICFGGTTVGKILYNTLNSLEMFTFTEGIMDLLQTYSQYQPFIKHDDLYDTQQFLEANPKSYLQPENMREKYSAVPLEKYEGCPRIGSKLLKNGCTYYVAHPFFDSTERLTHLYLTERADFAAGSEFSIDIKNLNEYTKEEQTQGVADENAETMATA